MQTTKNKSKLNINGSKFERFDYLFNSSRAGVNSNPNMFDSSEEKKNLSTDMNSNSMNYNQSISFKFGDGILYLDNENSLIIYKYVNELKPFYEEKYKQYTLPKWINKKHFEQFMNLLKILNNTLTDKESLANNNNSSSMLLTASLEYNLRNMRYDFDTSRILIGICSIFNVQYLTKILIEDNIQPNLDRFNCLKIIKDLTIFSIDENSQTNEFISHLVQRSIDIASKNIYYLINNMQDELLTITQDSLEEIIERYFENALFNTNIDHSLIMRVLIKSRNLRDIFELLEMERKKSIEIFERFYKNGLEPSIQWKIKSSDPCSGYYKESEEFNLEKITLILINYYDAQNDVYNIAIKLSENIKPNEEFNSEYGSENDSYIVSLLSICEIKEINFKSKINFTCIFSNTKTKVLACKIENFSKHFLEKGINFEKEIEYTVSIYFNLSYNFSAIMTHVCKNFYEYHTLTSISKIPKNVFNIILKYENLNKRSEDEILYSILTWVNHRQNVNSYIILELTKNVNWNLISLDCLLDFILTESKFLMNSKDLQAILIQEFMRRFKQDFQNEMGSLSFNKNNSTTKVRSSSVFNENSLNLNNNHNKSNDSCFNLSTSNNFFTKNNSFNRNYLTKGDDTKKSSFTVELVQKLINIAAKYEHLNNQPSTNLESINEESFIISYNNNNTKGGLLSKNLSVKNFHKMNISSSACKIREYNAIIKPIFKKIHKPRYNKNTPTILNSYISPLKTKNRVEKFSTMNLINTSQDVSMIRNYSNFNLKNTSNKNLTTSTNLNTNTNILTQSFSLSKNDVMNNIKQNEENNRKSLNKSQFSTFPSRNVSPMKMNLVAENSVVKEVDSLKLGKIPENYSKTKTNSAFIGGDGLNKKTSFSTVISNLNQIQDDSMNNGMISKISAKNSREKSTMMMNINFNTNTNKKSPKNFNNTERIVIKKFYENNNQKSQKPTYNRNEIKSPLRKVNTLNQTKINENINKKIITHDRTKSKEKNLSKPDSELNSSSSKFSNNQYTSLIAYKEYIMSNNIPNTENIFNSNCKCHLNVQGSFKTVHNSNVNNLNSNSSTMSQIKLKQGNNLKCEICNKTKVMNKISSVKSTILKGNKK